MKRILFWYRGYPRLVMAFGAHPIRIELVEWHQWRKGAWLTATIYMHESGRNRWVKIGDVPWLELPKLRKLLDNVILEFKDMIAGTAKAELLQKLTAETEKVFAA